MNTLFEVSWEVCNKVGGIYTVLESKAGYMREKVKNYTFIGPYFPGKFNPDFEEKNIPENLREAFKEAAQKGINCHYGIWLATLIPCILVDFSSLLKDKNRIKEVLWNNYKIDSLKSNYDFEEPVIWATSVGMLLEEISKHHEGIIAHFHEWLSGAGLLYIKQRKLNLPVVFTTHATVLERAMASAGSPFSQGNPDDLAYQYRVNDKHQIEKASALNADAFTSVSELTGNACAKILSRKPDVILLNGIDTFHFPNLEEISAGHRKNNEKIKDFVMSYFFPYYFFDIENTLFYYISGRYEFRNKGIDVYIKALGKLNEELKRAKSRRNVVAFIFIPSSAKEENISIVESKIFLENIKSKIREYSKSIENKIFYSLLSPNHSNLFDDKFLNDMKRLIRVMKKQGTPPILTHFLSNPENDAILNEIKKSGLSNSPDDKVKVIYYPVYLNPNDGILDMSYYEVIWGCHLGIFPSLYEPWGYTPVESAAFGVPAITTDLSGFGKYAEKEYKEEKAPGIIVIKRENKSDDEIVSQLADTMKWYLTLSKENRIKTKMSAETFISSLSWKYLIENYIQAYKIAEEKKR